MRVITVRLPASLHGRLQDKARETDDSLNSLCVTALRRELRPRLELEDGAIVIHQRDGSAQCTPTKVHGIGGARHYINEDGSLTFRDRDGSKHYS